MSLTTLRDNLAALPRLAWLDGVVESTLIRLSPDSDRPVLQVRTDRDQWVALHGRHDPARDARRLLDTIGVPARDAVVVLIGGAAGHVAEVLLEERHARHVVILEPHALAARTMLERRDWRAAFGARQLTLLVGPAYTGASDAWTCFDGVDDARIHVLEDTVLAREHDPLIGRARDVLGRIRFDAAANRHAREGLGATYALQTLSNLPEVVRAPSLRTLAGRAAGRPAVILAAGPSLWRNLEGHRAWRERVVVIAVDTTVRTALAHGLEPDYIVAADPTQANARHLRGLGTLTRSWLVAEPSLAPAALDVCGDRRTFFRVADNVPWPWLVQHGLDLPRLAVWGSVLTAAYSLARHLSCESISLLGADLAFTDGQPYTRGVAFEREWAHQRLAGVPVRQAWARHRRKRPVVEVPDVGGGCVASAPHLLAFRDWLVERSASDGIEVRNATGHGALLAPGIAQITTGGLSALPMPSLPFDPAPTGAGTSGDVARRLQAALADGSRSRAALDAALATCATAEEVGAALASVPARLDTGHRRVALAGPDARLLSAAYPWLDERLAQWCAARAGRTPPWLRPVDDADDADSRVQHADRLVAWLSRQTSLTSQGQIAAPSLPTTLPREVRLLMELPWQPDAEAGALTLQAIAAREAYARATLPSRWRADGRAAVANAPGAAVPVMHRHHERAARLAVVALRTQLAVCRAPEHRDPGLDVCATVLDACAPDGTGEDFVVRARVRLPDATMSFAATIGSGTLLGAMTGALMPADAGAPQPLTFAWTDGAALSAKMSIRHRHGASGRTPIAIGSPVAWLRSIWLTDGDVPPSYGASQSADGRHAVVTPRGTRASVAVDAGGRSTPLQEWPVALVAELHGPRWDVALSQDHGGHVCARRAGEAEVVTSSIAGVPYTAAWADDERVLVTTSTGLWEWSPGTAARHVVHVPAAAIVEVTGATVRLDPIPMVEGRYQPRVLREGWLVNLADGTVTRIALDTAGQAWSRTRRGDLAATAHPESNAIRFDAKGNVCWLAWHRPRGVVWVDEHLLVWGADGRIALVQGAWTTVTNTLTTATRDVHVTSPEGQEA